MKLLTQILLGLIVILFFSGCTSSSMDKATDASTPTNTLVVSANNEGENKKSADEHSSFPEEKQYSTRLLTTGLFHEDEVWPTAKQEQWVGLFKSNNAFYIAPTNITTEKVYDPILDEDSLTDKTGWQVEAVSKDTCIFLVSGSQFKEKKEIMPINLAQNVIYPSDTVSFMYLGTAYKLYATGKKSNQQNDALWPQVENYRLYLEARKEGKLIRELLVAASTFDEKMIEIIFAGDMDGDGFLDLLIDTSNHYNMFSPTLYLSKPAKESKLLETVARHVSVGC